MNDPIVSAIRMKLDDPRDHTTMQVSLNDYMQFSSWIDQQLITLQVSQFAQSKNVWHQKNGNWSTNMINR
ncbi:MAG: hypothetical protein COA78_25435 [Blastopirellula sp.]|nr:MAG: hypothetical protein COA78_25435 [Blastopirellula sp.]